LAAIRIAEDTLSHHPPLPNLSFTRSTPFLCSSPILEVVWCSEGGGTGGEKYIYPHAPACSHQFHRTTPTALGRSPLTSCNPINCEVAVHHHHPTLIYFVQIPKHFNCFMTCSWLTFIWLKSVRLQVTLPNGSGLSTFERFEPPPLSPMTFWQFVKTQGPYVEKLGYHSLLMCHSNPRVYY